MLVCTAGTSCPSFITMSAMMMAALLGTRKEIILTTVMAFCGVVMSIPIGMSSTNPSRSARIHADSIAKMVSISGSTDIASISAATSLRSSTKDRVNSLAPADRTRKRRPAFVLPSSTDRQSMGRQTPSHLLVLPDSLGFTPRKKDR